MLRHGVAVFKDVSVVHPKLDVAVTLADVPPRLPVGMLWPTLVNAL
jgi:hypothetical protein